MTFYFSPQEPDETVKNAIDAFREKYRTLYPNRAYSEFEGKSYDIDAAGFVYYEGVENLFGAELCDVAVPLVILKVLAHAYNAQWGIVRKEGMAYNAIKYPRLDFYVTVDDLVGKTFLPKDFDWDEFESPPSQAEIALESYEVLKNLFSYLQQRLGHFSS